MQCSSKELRESNPHSAPAVPSNTQQQCLTHIATHLMGSACRSCLPFSGIETKPSDYLNAHLSLGTEWVMQKLMFAMPSLHISRLSNLQNAACLMNTGEVGKIRKTDLFVPPNPQSHVSSLWEHALVVSCTLST